MSSMHESDGIGEALEDAVRLAVTAAARAAEVRLRERERELRELEARSAQDAADALARFAGERDVAKALLASAEHDTWWDTARPEQIRDVVAAATEWAPHDPDAAHARETIRRQLAARYGVDLDASTDEQPARTRRATDAVAVADRDDAATQDAYDTEERRAALAAELTGAGVDAAAVEARVLEDTGHALPPSAAVTHPPSARPARARPRRRQAQRRDRGRDR